MADEHTVRTELSPRRVRGVIDGRTIVDSTRALYLFETGHVPVYYFPRADVDATLLHPTDHHTRCPYKGVASYWSITTPERTVRNAVWAYPDPLDDVAEIADHVAFYWDAVDAWFEEDEEIYVHPRDPYKRVDAVASSRQVRISLDGVMLADSSRPTLVFETGLPTRYYLPKADVRLDLLRPGDLRTRCPYKGVARYWTAMVGTERLEVAWSYPAPIPEAPKIAELIAFYDERVDVTVDGVRQERPRTPWS